MAWRFFGKRHRRFCVVAIWTCVFTSAAVGGRAQTITGVVRDRSSGTAIRDAEITLVAGERLLERKLSDSRGRFTFDVPGSGWYRLHVQILGFHAKEATVKVGAYERVEVLVEMAPEAIELTGITVTSRNLDRRHRATYDGFRLRRESARPVGPERVVLRTDPEMQAAMSVDDVLKWFVGMRSCVVYFVDGVRQDARLWNVRDLSVSLLEGLEYYRDSSSAPLEYRGEPCGRSAADYSVVAVWRFRSSSRDTAEIRRREERPEPYSVR